MDRMLDQIGVAPEARDFASLETALADGLSLPAPQGIFPRFREPVPA
jgi:methionyl-tRNA synthetase